ncbi:hypothetical protein LCI18_008067 [Fusarium solani-melongenae]|uniref:Uncharacterized protein n=1 Tax=Fusarium solani subsp. cucurbitae TaxID=2747967 RepID=A0ACD3Z7Q9_FUSSC|nr:hypothetical protein LCI18_008067 [Fusarium solani-melongenae]
MGKPLFINFTVMNTPSHLTHGTWRKPGSRSTEYNTLDLWVDIANLAEKNKIDAIFFADVIGLWESQSGDWGKMARLAVQFPVSEPAVLLSAMAHATKNVGFMYTTSIFAANPFNFARTISTLDHVTNGRIAWNVVTGASKNGARSQGLPDIKDHDQRYAIADEYIDVTYKLWESSWDPEAVVKNPGSGPRDGSFAYADPAKVHKIHHKGERYSCEGPHLVEPSPQRVPVIVQAGSSGAGTVFAGKHAEAVFTIAGTVECAKKRYDAVLVAAEKQGRRKEDIHFIEGITVIVAETDEAARAKEAEYESWVSDEAHALMYGGATGVDLSTVDPEMPLDELIKIMPGMHGVVSLVSSAIKDRKPIVRDLLHNSAKGYRVVGSPTTVADRLEEFVAAGATGFNILTMGIPDTFEDFCKFVAPELRKRGLMREEYTPGTLREKMFPGAGPWVNERHAAHSYRYRFKDDGAVKID